MHYQFESKIAVEVLQKKSAWQIVCLVAGIIAVIAAVGLLLIEGRNRFTFLSSILVPLVLLSTGLRKNTKIEYIPTQIMLDISTDKVVISYPAVTRYVNGQTTFEMYEFSANNTECFQYSSELHAVRFWGNPVVTINGKRIDTEEMQERVVYLPPDRAEEICEEVEKQLGISAERMDP